MDGNNIVIKYLKSLGYNPSTDYYSYIRLWKSWYEGLVPSVHNYYDQNKEQRTIDRLGMAKRVCEDWASILYTERDGIVCENENNQKFIEKWFAEDKLDFNNTIPDNIETAFWSGTVGTIVKVVNVNIVNKKIQATPDTSFTLVNVNASQIIPLRIIDGKIVDVAFVSKDIIDNKKVFYIEIHTLKKDGYTIQNKYIDELGAEVKNDNVVEEFETDSKTPLFALLSPKIVNNNSSNNGLGISVYANAIDQLKAVDIVYNNFVKDFYLGGKKVFYNKKLTKYETITYTDEETGETVTQDIPIYPDDITKQQFQIIGDEADIVDSDTLIHEHNPDLRETDNENGNNFALNMLAFKTGLGKSYYKMEQNGVVTATQAILDNKDLVGNAKKHRTSVNKYTVAITKAVLMLGRILLKEPVSEEDNIKLVDKDGYLVSEEDQKSEFREEISMGLRSKTSYLMTFYGMSEEEALKEIALINQEDQESFKQPIVKEEPQEIY